MKINIRHIYVSMALAAIIAAVTQAFTIGYGVTFVSAADSAAMPASFSTDVIYEYTCHEHSDFIHLKIDTAYRKTGKGRFKSETICDRKMSLRRFDGTYADCSSAKPRCFAYGSDITWRDTGETRRIMNYECRRATASFNDRTWEIWYTLLLPRSDAGARTSDRLAGLILEARDMNGDCSLKIRHISEIS